MLIRSKAPLRLGLAGGGSDVSPYSDKFGGLVLNATINLYAYCTIEETFDGLITINSYDSKCFKSFPSAEELPLDGEASLIKGVYNRIQRDFAPGARSFRITTWNDAPAGSGLGTSSTMVVCILKAFTEWMYLPWATMRWRDSRMKSSAWISACPEASRTSTPRPSEDSIIWSSFRTTS